MVRDCAVYSSVEAGDRAACVQDVEQDRSHECRRDHVCVVVCRNFGDSVYVQILHHEQLYGVYKKYLAEHIALPVLESPVLVHSSNSLHFFISKLKIEHVNIFAYMLRVL